jgi:hypothetical protein
MQMSFSLVFQFLRIYPKHSLTHALKDTHAKISTAPLFITAKYLFVEG